MLLGKAEGVITLDISDLQAKAAMATASLNGLGKSATGFDRLDAQLQSVGMSTDRLGTGFVALGAAMLAPMGIGLSHAIDLEHQLKGVEIALGDVSDHDFSKLSDQINEIGINGEFSAIEIAVMTEQLAKAGFTIEDIMSGDPAEGFGNMSQAVSDLASATGDGLVPATEGMIVAMSTWRPEIVGVENALTDANKAADIFTIAANNSIAGVADITSGMRNFGPTAALMGVSFEEAAASIATFTNYGLTAREAGTSLTRALTMLADPTSEASQLMDDLGIAAFDLEGNFVGLPSLMDQLEQKMGDMSQEQKLAALNTIFGAEAMDVMGLSVLGAGDDVEKLMDIMAGGDGYVSAADQARARTDTLRGALDRLREGLATTLGMLAHGLIGPIRIVADTLDGLISLFTKMPKPIVEAIGLVITGIGLLLAATGAFLIMGPRVAQFMTTVRLMSQLPGILGAGSTAFLRLASAARVLILVGSGLGVIVGIVTALVKLDLFGFGTAWDRAADAFRQAADSGNAVAGVINAISAAIKSFDLGPLNALAGVLDGIATGWTAFWSGFNEGGGSATETVTKQFEGFAELQKDGITWLVRTEGGDEVGQIIDSWDNADGTTTVKIKTEGGEVLETTIDMATGFVSTDYETTVTVDAKDVPNTLERLRNGFEYIQHAGETLNMDWLASIGEIGIGAVDRIDTLTTAFDQFRKTGSDPVHASLGALSQAFPELNGVLVPAANLWMATKEVMADVADTATDLGRKGLRLLADGAERAWDMLGEGVDILTDVGERAVDLGERGLTAVIDGVAGLIGRLPRLSSILDRGRDAWSALTSVFTRFRSQGLGPISAAWATFTTLLGEIDLAGVAGRIRDALGSLFAGIGDWIVDALPDVGAISDAIGNWIADLFDSDEVAGGGVMGQGVFGKGMSEAMQDDLERAAKGAWERAWDNFSSWVTGQAVSIGGWVLDTGVPTVTGWLSTAGSMAWESLKELAGWAWDNVAPIGTITIAVAGWVVETTGSIADAIMAKVNSLLYGGDTAGGGASLAAAVGGGGFPIEAIALAIGSWTVTSLEDLHAKVDEHIETALGETFVFTIDISLDYAFAFVGDPGSVAKATLLAILGAALAVLLVTGGVTSILALAGVIGIAALGYYIVTQVMDYFDRNPAEIERLKVRVGELWADLKESEIGWFFTGLEKLAGIVASAVDKLIHLREILLGLPGPMGDVASAAEKMVLALAAISAIAFIGGAGGRVGGRGRTIGFLEGLFRGLMKIATFPFRLVFNPIKTLKGLLGIGGKGSRGGRGRLGFLELLGGVIKLPFRTAKLGLQSIGNAFSMIGKAIGGAKGVWDTFFRGYGRAIKQSKQLNLMLAHGQNNLSKISHLVDGTAVTFGQKMMAMKRGLRGVFEELVAGKGFVRTFLRSFVRVGSALDGPLLRIDAALSRMTQAIGARLSAAIGPVAIAGIKRSMWLAFNIAFAGIPALIRGIMDGSIVPAIGRLFGAMSTSGPIVSGLARFGSYLRRQALIYSFGFLESIAGVFSRSRGVIGYSLRGIGSAFDSAILRMFGPETFLKVRAGLAKFGQQFKRLLFGPSGMGIVADPKAFQAFSAITDMVDDVARRVGKFKQFGKLFSGFADNIGAIAKPFAGLTDNIGAVLRVATRLSPVLRAIGTAFAFFGIERGIAKLWDAVGGFEGIKDAWAQVKQAFDVGGISGVLNLVLAALRSWGGKAIAAIREGLSDLTLGDIWDFITESAANIDWVTVAGLVIAGLTLMIAGIPGILIGIAATLLWDWIDDSLRAYDWGNLRGDLADGFRSALSVLGDIGSWAMDAIRAGADLLGDLAGWFAGQLAGVNWGEVARSSLSALSRFGEWVLDLIGGVVDLGSRILSWFRDQVSGVNWGDVARTSLSALARFGEWVLEVIRGAQALGDRILAWFSDQIAAVNWGDVARSSLSALARFGDWLLEAIRGSVDLSGRILSWFSGQISAVNWGDVARTSLSALARFGDWLLERIKGSTPIQTRISNWLGDQLRGVDWAGVAQSSLNALARFGDWVLEKISGAMGLATRIVNWFTSQLAGVDWAGLAQESLAVLADFGNWALEKIGAVKTTLVEKGRDLLDGLRIGAEAKWTEITSWVSGLKDTLLSYFDWITPTTLTDVGRMLIDSLKAGLENAFAGLLDWLAGKVNPIIEGFNDIIAGVNAVAGAIGLDSPIEEIPLFNAVEEEAASATASVEELEGAVSTVKRALGIAIRSMGEGLGAAELEKRTPSTDANLETVEMNPAATGGGYGRGGDKWAGSFIGLIRQTMLDAKSEVDTGLRTIGTVTIPSGLASWSTSMAMGLSGIGMVAATGFAAIPAAVGPPMTQTAAIVAVQTGMMATTATGNWGLMRGSAVATFPAISGIGIRNVTQMGAGIAGSIAETAGTWGTRLAGMTADTAANFASIRQTGSSESRTMGTTVSTNVGTMATDSAAKVLGMKMGIAASMLAMRTSSISETNTMVTGMRFAFSVGMLGILTTIRNAMGAIPGIIASAGSSAIATAISIGRAIGNGVAAGIRSAQGAVAAAAAAIIATANMAMSAAAIIRSPSRLFRKDIGRPVTQGVALGMLDEIPKIEAAGALVMRSAYAVGRSGAYGRSTMGRGGVGTYQDNRSYRPEITIVQRPGEDNEDLARRVAARQERDFDSVFGGKAR